MKMEISNKACKFVRTLRTEFCEIFEKAKFNHAIVEPYIQKLMRRIKLGLTMILPESDFIFRKNEEINLPTQQTPIWIVYPIEGVLNFMHANPECCIAIGLCVNAEMVLGIVYNPLTEELYYADSNERAALNGVSLKRPFVGKKIQNNFIIAYDLKINEDDIITQADLSYILNIAQNCVGIRSYGSTQLSFCYMAAGHVVAYIVKNPARCAMSPGNYIFERATAPIE